MSDVKLDRTISRLVIVGASLAGARVAEGARRLGFTGSITMIGAEHNEPYDRPPLSKLFLTAEAEPLPDFHLAGDLDVTFLSGTTATSLDSRHRRLRTTRGDVERSEEHTSELQSLMRISYAVFCSETK